MEKNSKPVTVKDSDIQRILGEAIKVATSKKKTGGFLFVTVDNLSMVISSRGQAFAEEVMQDVIKQIKKNLSTQDYIARANRDSINIVLHSYALEEIKNIVKKTHKTIQNYGCKTSTLPIHLISTIGSVDFPYKKDTAEDIINKAYIALNDAKEKFRHYEHYDNNKKHKVESTNKLILANYIQTALLNNKLRLAFQPIVDRKTGEVECYECLLRIINDEGVALSAGPFVPIAEKMGFIDVIDTMVLEMVVEELKNSPNVKLGVNLSNVTIENPEWLKCAIKLLDDRSVAKRLIIEIIETAEQQDIKKVIHFINTMRDLGCEISLDDFGTGYTSFSQLKKLPIDTIKIDGSFIKDITHNDENKFFVKTLMDFSHNFGVKTIAEYVENKEIAEILSEMKIDYMQGNYFSPAVNYRPWVEKDILKTV